MNADVPKLEVHFLDYPDKEINQLGARGIGEIGLAGIAAAITAATHHATGIRVRELPITDRGSAEIVSLGLTNEGTATNHPTRRRISCAAMGPGDISSDARLDLSKSWRASVSRSEWGYAWFSDWRLP